MPASSVFLSCRSSSRAVSPVTTARHGNVCHRRRPATIPADICLNQNRSNYKQTRSTHAYVLPAGCPGVSQHRATAFDETGRGSSARRRHRRRMCVNHSRSGKTSNPSQVCASSNARGTALVAHISCERFTSIAATTLRPPTRVIAPTLNATHISSWTSAVAFPVPL